MMTFPGLGLRCRTLAPAARRFFCFCLVGFSGVFVDMGLLYLLSDPTAFGWPFPVGKSLAVEAAIINNFIWNEIWTFGDIAVSRKCLWDRLRRFIRFNLVCLAGLLVGLCILSFLHGRMEFNLYLSNLVAIIGATGWNFLLNARFSWATPRMATEATSETTACGDYLKSDLET